MEIKTNDKKLKLTTDGKFMTSLEYDGYEVLASYSPTFRAGVRGEDGSFIEISSADAKSVIYDGYTVRFCGFSVPERTV